MPFPSTSFCNAAIAINTTTTTVAMGDPFRLSTDDELSDERLTALTGYLSSWALGYGQLTQFVDEFVPFTSTQTMGAGCASGHVPYVDGQPRVVYVSLNDLHGCAQGIYHEFAHLKLESIGIGIEEHDGRLLLNGPTELYDSSVRFDKKRPMSAVLHGVYAWMHFTELDYHIYQSGRCDLQEFKTYAAHNFPKIAKGVDEMRRYARWTVEGEVFAESVYRLADDLVARGTDSVA